MKIMDLSILFARSLSGERINIFTYVYVCVISGFAELHPPSGQLELNVATPLLEL